MGPPPTIAAMAPNLKPELPTAKNAEFAKAGSEILVSWS
jgi:hypothetical protein